MTSAPRVLAVFVDRPWPGVTGDMERVRAFLTALDGAAEVRVIVAARPGTPSAPPPPGLPVLDLERNENALISAVRFAAGLPARRPPMMAFYRQPHVRAAVAESVAAFAPDVVLTHHLGGAVIVDGVVDPASVVLDLPNDEVARFGRLASLRPGVGGLRYRAESSLTSAWARRHLGRYRAVTVVSDEDADGYRRLAPQARIIVVPNGTDPPPSPRPDPGGRSLLFLGDLAYEPNRDGIEWFIRSAWPGIEGAELRVVGRGHVSAAPGVDALGFVDDLTSELARATAMVVPLRAGGGTRLKVLQAFGFGIPVVSTRIGVEGLGAVPGTHYLPAETPEEWVSCVERVLMDQPLRAALAAAGRALVEERFTWPRATAPLRDVVVA